MEKKFDFDCESFNLEMAENLISIYLDFIGNECPRIDKYTDDAAIAACIYVSRTEMFESTLRAAWDTIHNVRMAMENREVVA